jgi:hypothetical protein
MRPSLLQEHPSFWKILLHSCYHVELPVDSENSQSNLHTAQIDIFVQAFVYFTTGAEETWSRNTDLSSERYTRELSSLKKT